ncbi:MAG: respiratory nitrate reductase subunit gamma [Anaerolineae bacterium]|nr:respiratory nitrate reductase subunit gamma [Anaerolineae bacterium]
MDRLTLFWRLHLALLGLFAMEMGWLLSVWLRAWVPGLPADAPRWRKLLMVAGRGVRFLFSCRFPAFLGCLLGQGLLHRQVLQASRFRWVAHLLVFGSFFALGILSTVTGVAVEVLPAAFPMEHILNANALSSTLRNMDHPAVALANEVLGLLMLLGLALAAWRRYVRREPNLRTGASDGVFLGLLALIALSGYAVEAFRLLAEGAQGARAWAFLGAGLAALLARAPARWEAWHQGAFWFHFAVANLLLFYAPFSRFFHALASPLVAALNAMEEAS